MPTTTNYGWTTPADTDLVKDGASAIRTLGSSVDTTVKNLNPETTLGDIAYRSSTANVNTRLALGTAGQVLTVNSGATAPEWQTINQGGMTLISTTTLTGASLSLSSIPQTYNNLQLIIRNFKPSVDGELLRCRVNGDSTASRHTSPTTNLNFNGGTTNTFDNTRWPISYTADNSSARGLSVVNIFDYKNTVTWKLATVWSIVDDSAAPTTNYTMFNSVMAYNQIGAITSLDLLVDSGTMTSGTALLYGVK